MNTEKMPTKKLGVYKDRKYFLYAHVKPSFNNIQEYVITIYYKNREEDKNQIARFDDSHGFKHFDKLFDDHPYKNSKPPTKNKGFWDLYRFAENKWKTWARKYEEINE